MENKYGFTLIELLAVIIILAIIALIATPVIIGLIEDARKESSVNSAYGIIGGAEIGFAKILLDQDIAVETKYTYKDGVENREYGNIELNYNGKKLQNGTIIISSDGKIAISFYENGYCIFKTFDDSQIKVEEKDNKDCVLYADYILDEGVNKPSLGKGMIPVMYYEDNWVKADTSNVNTTYEWYEYSITAKKWANAVTVSNNRTTYLNAPVGTIIPMEDINAFWVWIPRYAYNIESGYHKNIEGTINVKFLIDNTDETRDETEIERTPLYSESDDDTQLNYITHPAFTFGTTELTGLWVAKFEASGTISQIDFKPNVSQLFNVSVGDVFTFVRNMEKTDRYGWNKESGTLSIDGTFTTNNNNIDTHMMKNTEWGAIAYLSHSMYGIPSEIFTNPSINYITGRGGETVSQGGTEDTTDIASPTLYGYDGKSCSSKIGNVCTGATHEIYGTASSTTGTIYGIYGISSQGVYEYVMGNFNNTAGSSGLTPADINNKYIDRYTGYNDTVFGDAVWETSSSASSPYENSWYDDYSAMVNASRPWFWRGGGFGTKAGAFFFYTFDGSANVGGFRTTLVVDEGL